MKMALYYPGEGYYTSNEDCIGKNGDYYTSPELTSIFGTLLGKQLEEMWNLLDKKAFTIVEYGAGPGTLCHDILYYLGHNSKLYERLHYCIIEKSPVMIAKEKQLLSEKVSWYDCIDDIPFPVDCVLSNEVLDNFPIHLVLMKQELMEVFVDYKNGFKEFLQPAAQELKDYLHQLQVVLPEGYRTEINIEALRWLKNIAKILQKGFIVTIDYGFTAAELYNPSRCQGTLLCYNRHSINDSLYTTIGGQDITAHVNFSALRHWGQQYGLQCCGYTSQSKFLRSLGLVPALNSMEDNNDTKTAEKVMKLYNCIINMSNKFNILVQQKGLQQPRLTGLQFAQSFV